MAAIASSATNRGVYVNEPSADWKLLCELIPKFGRRAEIRKQQPDRFAGSCPSKSALTEKEIIDEENAVRDA